MQDGSLATLADCVYDFGHQRLRIATPAKIRMGADGAYLRESRQGEPLTRHRSQPSIFPNSQKVSQFNRSGAKGTGIGELRQRQHLLNVVA